MRRRRRSGWPRAYLVPLAAGLALGVDEVRDVLERNLLTTGRRVGQLLHPHVLERTSSAGQVRYRLALFDAAPDGSFDLGDLMRRAGLAAAEAATAVLGAGGGALPLGDLPLSVRIASLTAGGDSRFGVALDIPVGKQFVLFDSSDVRLSLEVVDEWLADPGIAPPTVGGRGLELYVAAHSRRRGPVAGSPGGRARSGTADRPTGRREAARPRGHAPLGRRARLPGQGHHHARRPRRWPPRARPVRAPARRCRRQPGGRQLHGADERRR